MQANPRLWPFVAGQVPELPAGADMTLANAGAIEQKRTWKINLESAGWQNWLENQASLQECILHFYQVTLGKKGLRLKILRGE